MRATRLIGSFVILLTAASVWATTPQVIHGTEGATALVRVLSNGKPTAYGSAFCFDDMGLFITNAHVADGKSDIDLVLDPGQKSQRLVAAKVLRSDAQLDLSVLQALDGRPFPAIHLGKIDELVETQDIIAFGYPFGAAMALDSQGFPSISVNTGHITSLRKKDGELTLIQIDAAVNPGNSGGPVIDSDGNVIGIVEAGILGTGMNFAIPINRLDKLLKDPLAVIAPSTLRFDRRNEAQSLTIKVISRPPPASEYEVELSLTNGDATPRVMTGRTKDAACSFNIPLVPPTGNALSHVIVSGTFPDGVISGRAVDRSIQVGGEKVKLSEVQTIEPNGDGTSGVTTADKKLTGRVAGMNDLSVVMAGATVRPD